MAKGLSKEELMHLTGSITNLKEKELKKALKTLDKKGQDYYAKKVKKIERKIEHSHGKKGVIKQAMHDLKKVGKKVASYYNPKKQLKELKRFGNKVVGDPQGKAKAERRAVNIREEYGDLLKDPTLWDKWSKSKRHRFSKDVARADKYGANPFKTLSGMKGHKLREKVRATSKAVHYKNEERADAKKKLKYYQDHPDKAKKDGYNIAEHEAELSGTEIGGNLGSLKQLPRYNEAQQKLLNEKTQEARKQPGFDKTDLGKKLNQQMAQQIANGPPKEYKRKEPKLETPGGTGRALNQKVDFKPAKIGDYQNYYESILGKGLEAASRGKIKEFNEEILPELKSAFVGRQGSSAYENAIAKSKSNLDETLLRLKGEYAEKAANLSQGRQSLDINAQQAGTGRGSAQAGYIQGVGLGGYNAATGRYGERIAGQRLDQGTWQQQNQNYQNAINAAQASGNTYEANRLAREQQALSAQPHENLYIQPQNGSGGYFGSNMNVQSTYNPPNYLQGAIEAGAQAAAKGFFG